MRNVIKETMSGEKWVAAFGYGSVLLKEYPSSGEEKDGEDPLFDDKKKWSHAMRLKKQIWHPDSFRASYCGPVDDLSTQNRYPVWG